MMKFDEAELKWVAEIEGKLRDAAMTARAAAVAAAVLAAENRELKAEIARLWQVVGQLGDASRADAVRAEQQAGVCEEAARVKWQGRAGCGVCGCSAAQLRELEVNFDVQIPMVADGVCLWCAEDAANGR